MNTARTMQKLARLLAVAGTGFMLATAAWAHHSQSEFDFKLNVDVGGTITKLELRGPHARLYHDVYTA